MALATKTGLVASIVRDWKYSHAPNADATESEYVKFWYVMPDGATGRIPALSLEGHGPRVAKDSYVLTASLWCKLFQPDAIVFASEVWSASLDDRAMMEKLQAAFPNGLPLMQEPENRQLLRERFGVNCSESLMVFTQAIGRADTFQVHALQPLPDGSKGYDPTPVRVDADAGDTVSMRWRGILQGELAIRAVGQDAIDKLAREVAAAQRDAAIPKEKGGGQ